MSRPGGLCKVRGKPDFAGQILLRFSKSDGSDPLRRRPGIPSIQPERRNERKHGTGASMEQAQERNNAPGKNFRAVKPSLRRTKPVQSPPLKWGLYFCALKGLPTASTQALHLTDSAYKQTFFTFYFHLPFLHLIAANSQTSHNTQPF